MDNFYSFPFFSPPGCDRDLVYLQGTPASTRSRVIGKCPRKADKKRGVLPFWFTRNKQTIYQMIIIKYDLYVMCLKKRNLSKTGMIWITDTSCLSSWLWAMVQNECQRHCKISLICIGEFSSWGSNKILSHSHIVPFGHPKAWTWDEKFMKM